MTIPVIDVTFLETYGLTTKIWIQGRTFTRDPQIEVIPKRMEFQTQTSSMGRRVDRLFVKPGWANILERHEIVMNWPNIHELSLLQHLNTLAAMGRPFHLTIWKQVFEAFDGDGVRTDFFLQRRLALGYAAPPVTYPQFPTRVAVYDQPFTNAESPFAGEPKPTAVAVPIIVHKTAANILSGTPAAGVVWLEDDGHVEGDRWLTRVRFGTPPPAIADSVVIFYLPLYRGVIDQVNPRSYREALAEPRGFKFAEL